MALVEYRAAVTGAVDFEKRTIEVISIPYNEVTQVEHRGRVINEVVEPGAFRDVDPEAVNITVNRDHDYMRTVGSVKAVREDPAGFVTTVYVSRTLLGDETLTLADDRILGASVGMLVGSAGMQMRGDTRHIFRASLDHVAMLPNPAYKGAKVLAVRADQAADVPTPNLDLLLAHAGIADLLRAGASRYGAGKE